MQFEICDKCGSNQPYAFFKNELLCDSCYKDEKAKLLVKHKINTSKSQRLYLIYHEMEHLADEYLVAIFHNLENAFDYLMIKTGNYNLYPAKYKDSSFKCLEQYEDINYDQNGEQMIRVVDHWYSIVVMQSNDISEDSELIRNILISKQ